VRRFACCRLVADHPWPRGGEALCTAFRPVYAPCGSWRAAAAASTMRGPVLIECPRLVTAPFIDGLRLALLGRHAGEVGHIEKSSRRLETATFTARRQIAFEHRPHFGEGSAIRTEIVVDGHLCFRGCSLLSPAKAGIRYAAAHLSFAESFECWTARSKREDALRAFAGR